MTSLWELAQKKLQPDIQYMDQETIDKIRENKPLYETCDTNFYLTNKEMSLIKSLMPKLDWYLNLKITSSIHGITHAVRVMIYALLLTRNSITNNDMEALLIACAIHDTQRQNDKGDEEHEDRVINWFLKNFVQDSHFNQVLLILRGESPLSKYLKTADALDRFRLPKVKWWINDLYLEIKPISAMREFSFNLIISSEQRKINGEGDFESVFSCLQIQ